MLANNIKLAKTSALPAKTQLINHFDIDKTWYIADLPGYGFAKVPQSQRKQWEKMIEAISSRLLESNQNMEGG
jgi:GTP-binding protein